MNKMIPRHAVEVRLLLNSTNLTDRQLADRIDTSHASIYRWRHGESVPSFADAKKLVEVVKDEASRQMQMARELDETLEDSFIADTDDLERAAKGIGID